MKKILTMILILFSITLMSCKKDEYIIINEVKNYEVDVEEKITISTLEDALVNAIKKAEQSVIGVIATSGSIFSGESFGSGVIIASKKINNPQQKYYVVTNRHVILNKSNKTYSQIKIYYGNMDNLIEAELLMYDETQDLALLSFVTEETIAVCFMYGDILTSLKFDLNDEEFKKIIDKGINGKEPIDKELLSKMVRTDSQIMSNILLELIGKQNENLSTNLVLGIYIQEIGQTVKSISDEKSEPTISANKVEIGQIVEQFADKSDGIFKGENIDKNEIKKEDANIRSDDDEGR